MIRKYTPKWHVSSFGGMSEFYVDNGDRAFHTNAHCMCCALVEALSKHGGDVDLRGLHRYGMCYQWLVVTAKAIRDPQPEESEAEAKNEPSR